MYMFNSANFLPPYLQETPIFKDLCFFIDYLDIDIENVFNDLRYKYIDYSKVSEESAHATLDSMGLDYLVDIIDIITPSSTTQLLALSSVLWLLKGQLLGVDILASICGFTYDYTVWHEQVPLGEPNTATMRIKFYKKKILTEDFQRNFSEFLRKYLYPIIDVTIQSSPSKGSIYSYGYLLNKEKFTFKEVTV